MMKRWMILMCVLIVGTSLIGFQTNADSPAGGVPYQTVTPGVHGRLVPTQAAYVPVGILNHGYSLNNPNDIHVKDEYIYVANTNSSNVVIFHIGGNFVKTIGEGILQQPLGIFVDHNDLIYVADKEAQAVFKFDFEGQLLQTFSRPTEPLFGSHSVYRPEKVVVDRGGTLYIAGEGAVNGLIQLNYEGRFRGYFAVNQTRFDWRMRFTDLFLGITDQLARNLPPAPTNLAIDDKGLIYTITPNIDQNVKKFNLMSVAILAPGFYSEERPIDIVVDKYGGIFVLDREGRIHHYDAYGRLMFRFGGLDTGNQRLGLINTPTAIGVDAIGNLYVLDRGYNQIQIFHHTRIVEQIQLGNQYFDEGLLDESRVIWEDIYRMNATFSLANSALGRIHLKERNFDEALEHFVAARDRGGYSEAFWEVRNTWLQHHSGTVILSFLGLGVCNFGLKISGVKATLTEKRKRFFERLKHHKVVRDLFLIPRIIRHPADTYYRIKHQRQGSYGIAHGIYATLFIFMILSYAITSFLFSAVNVSQINLLMEFAQIIGILMLWNLGNYLITSLTDGEGWFRDIYIATAYALAPLIIGILPLAILSNVLTYNEIFIYQFIRFMMIGYTAILLFIMVKEVHNFKLGETLKNIILTLFTMIILALLIFVIYLLFNQLLEFLISLVREVIVRAKH